MSTGQKPHVESRRLLALALVPWAGLFLLYLPVFFQLYRAWRIDPYYSHGILIPPVALLLFYLERQKLAGQSFAPPSGTPWWLGSGLFVYLLGAWADFRFLMYLSFPASVAGMIHYLYGRETLRAMAFPLGFLLFMVPIPYTIPLAIGFPLQTFSAKYASALVGLTGIPTWREGVNLFIPGFHFIVERGCSGLSSILALLALAVLFTYFLPAASWPQRVFLWFSAFPIALAANVVRISAVILLGHFFGPAAAQGFYENFSGLVIFGLAFLMLYFSAWRLGCLRKES